MEIATASGLRRSATELPRRAAAAALGSAIFGMSQRGEDRHRRQNSRKEGKGLSHGVIIDRSG